jgi:hypothetical protein
MTLSINSLNQMSLADFHRLFARLEPPQASSLSGIARGVFVGQAWMRSMWGPLLALTGLGGWWGKEFDTEGNAVNLVLRRGKYERRFPMYPVQQVSYLDYKNGLALRYQPENPFPRRFILDELRRIDATTVLGMTLVDIRPLRRMAFPFILQSREVLDGL